MNKQEDDLRLCCKDYFQFHQLSLFAFSELTFSCKNHENQPSYLC